MNFNYKLSKGFTLAELVISVAIIAIIATSVIVMMTRGASNVQKGSHIAQASSQAAWLVSTVRRDMTNSRFDRISCDSKWTGTTPLKIKLNDGHNVSYTVVKSGSGKALLRHVAGGRKQYFAKESFDSIEGVFKKGIFHLSITLSDPSKKANNLVRSSLIVPPQLSGADEYWKPLSSLKK